MKKILFVALTLLVGASFSTAEAGKKKDKKKQARVEAPVQLNNRIDSLSYALGMTQSQGLLDYLAKQLEVDTTKLEPFVEGLKEGAQENIDKEKAAFFAGIQIGQQIANQMLKGINKQIFGEDTTQSISLKTFMAAFITSTTGKQGLMTMPEAEENTQRLMQQMKEETAQKVYGSNREAGEKFLEENKKQEGVIIRPSGLQYKILKQGEGLTPEVTDQVKVLYEGRLVDGTVFDSTAKHGGQPATLRPDQVIAGWREALTMMPVGSKWQLFIPYNLGYGEREAGQIKPFSALIFDVELVDIVK